MLVLFNRKELKISDYTAIQELLVAPYLKDFGKKQDLFFHRYSFYFVIFYDVTIQLAVSVD